MPKSNPNFSLGGMEVWVAPFPSQIKRPGAWNSRWISPMMYAEGRREGWKGPFPLTGVRPKSYSFTHSLSSNHCLCRAVPPEGRFLLLAAFYTSLLPAPCSFLHQVCRKIKQAVSCPLPFPSCVYVLSLAISSAFTWPFPAPCLPPSLTRA